MAIHFFSCKEMATRFQDQLLHDRWILENDRETGEVELCHHVETGEQYVRKLIQWANRSFAAREIATSRVIPPHENIIQMVDSDLKQGQVRLVYRYAKNGDLFDYLQSNPSLRRDIGWIAHVFLSIVLGLEHMHKHGLLHRDIKLENVILTADGRAQICDFSFAEWISDPVDLRRTSSHGITKRNSSEQGTTFEVDSQVALRKITRRLVGTAGCISPELARTYRATESTDVFGLGVLLYEMVTGRKAYPDHLSIDIFYPSWLRQCDDGALCSLIRSMLSTESCIRLEDIIHNEWLRQRAQSRP